MLRESGFDACAGSAQCQEVCIPVRMAAMQHNNVVITGGPTAKHSTHAKQHSSPVTLNNRTSSRNALNTRYTTAADETPSTPPPIRKRPAKKHGKEPAKEVSSRAERLRREESAARDLRQSHGLSWSSTTRDSVVDNLLLTLDGMSMPGVDAAADDDFDIMKYRPPQVSQLEGFTPQKDDKSTPLPSSKPTIRARGHTYSSSLSSGYDGYGTVGVDSPGSRQPGSARGRRSNSSSNIGVVQSSNARARRPMTGGRMSSDTQGTTTRDGTHSKNGSDLGSISQGYGSIIEANRQNWGGRRSMSMDQMYTETSGVLSVLDRGRPVPSVHSPFDTPSDAAPEPSIASGPRKMQNPTASGPVYVNPAPTKSSALRKVNTQSDLRTVSKPNAVIPQDIRNQANDFVRENSMRSGLIGSTPHSHSASVPSPAIQGSRRTGAPSPHRERPGFFKRVFGSGSRTPSGLSERSDSHSQQDSIGHLDTALAPPRSKSQASNDTSSQTRKPSKELAAPPAQPPASLNKKPSSFFRRRKKSSSDSMPPPPLPLNNLRMNVPAAHASPSISSLREVMNPYLTNAETKAAAKIRPREGSRPDTCDSATDSDLDIFHSGYSPPPDASLGRRDPFSRQPSSLAREELDTESSSQTKLRVRKRKAEVASPGAVPPVDDGNFLHDASRATSTATLGDHFKLAAEQPSRVSPLSEAPPEIATDVRPVSRASTGDRIIAAKTTTPIEASEEMRAFSAGNNINVYDEDDGWIVQHAPSPRFQRPDSRKSERLILKPTPSYEDLEYERGLDAPSVAGHSRETSQSLHLRKTSPSTSALYSPGALSSVYHSTTSLPLPSVQLEGNEITRSSIDIIVDRPASAVVDTSTLYTERARRIFTGDEADVTQAEAASWLGEKNAVSTNTLLAYMQLFDSAGQNMLSALRTLAGKLLLRGETQQFDRIITALSERWCECNPRHGFKAQDVVHTMLYSLILLNTDLHLADIGEKMSRTAYVKNTLPTIRRVVADAAPNAFDDNTVRPGQQNSRPSLPWMESLPSVPTSPTFSPASETLNERTSLDVARPNAYKRLSMRPGMLRSDSDTPAPDGIGSLSNGLVNSTWTGNMRGWETEIEIILKAFFASIRSDPLPLMSGTNTDAVADRTLTVNTTNGLKRSGSVVSKAPSDNMSYRSKPGFRTLAMGWQNRNTRSRPKLYPASTIGGSSRTSFDDSNSIWSPTQSSSKNSFAKTLTSASANSLGWYSSQSGGDFKHSIGFANALSQAIIREEGVTNGAETESLSLPAHGLLKDDALALEGAPWAKEGLVKHKHHLEMSDRKAKDRNWNDCFAVLGKGKLTLFAFNTATSKANTLGRSRALARTGAAGKAASVAATHVGGGDWMENAEQLDVFVLRQTIASTLPSPGYSKTRPHVWALSLPSGAVHLFQVGTPEIAREFMDTANYWSARLSKEPLSGSVSNIEYGWSDQVINMALVERRESSSVGSPPPSMQNMTNGATRHMHSSSNGATALPRPSFQSSVRGSFDTGFGGGSTTGGKARLPGDKAQIMEWHAPTQSLMASQLMEVDQLRALTAYVANVEQELARHNEVRGAIELGVSLFQMHEVCIAEY